MRQQLEQVNWKKLDRRDRGKLLVKSVLIEKTADHTWRVSSQTNPGKNYRVKFRGHNPYCDCPDCTIRKEKCKHIWAVEFYIRQEIDKEGKLVEKKGVKISYEQKWKAYDKSQTGEKLYFMKLLKDLTNSMRLPITPLGTQ